MKHLRNGALLRLDESDARALTQSLPDLVEENRYYHRCMECHEESGKNWGEADGELCELLDFINSYVMHIEESGQRHWSLCPQTNTPNVSIFPSA